MTGYVNVVAAAWRGEFLCVGVIEWRRIARRPRKAKQEMQVEPARLLSGFIGFSLLAKLPVIDIRWVSRYDGISTGIPRNGIVVSRSIAAYKSLIWGLGHGLTQS